jgi:rSAM/selenodomain-associated transferase 1
MARAPSAGKTRLAPYLSPRRLEALRRALLADTLDEVAHARGAEDEAVVFVAPAGSEAEIATLTAQPFSYVSQPDGDLGQRMKAAFEELLIGRRCEAALLVGSDIPLLDGGMLAEAGEAVRSIDGVVLGPADDGGYYLIGMSQLHAAVFDGVAWGTATVLEETLRAAERAAISTRLIRRAFDVDTIEDLQRVERVLASAPPGAAPRLRQWFASGR